MIQPRYEEGGGGGKRRFLRGFGSGAQEEENAKAAVGGNAVGKLIPFEAHLFGWIIVAQWLGGSLNPKTELG